MIMSNEEYYNRIEQILENQIKSVKKASWLFADSSGIIKGLSSLVSKTRELKNGT